MKVTNLYLSLDCECGSHFIVDSPVDQPVRQLAEVIHSCGVCGTKYFIHIQESKREKRDT